MSDLCSQNLPGAELKMFSLHSRVNSSSHGDTNFRNYFHHQRINNNNNNNKNNADKKNIYTKDQQQHTDLVPANANKMYKNVEMVLNARKNIHSAISCADILTSASFYHNRNRNQLNDSVQSKQRQNNNTNNVSEGNSIERAAAYKLNQDRERQLVFANFELNLEEILDNPTMGALKVSEAPSCIETDIEFALNISSTSSSNSSNSFGDSKAKECLAYHNLTYAASNENLNPSITEEIGFQRKIFKTLMCHDREESCYDADDDVELVQTEKNNPTSVASSDLFKKTLKSIKRKDRLKKNQASTVRESDVANTLLNKQSLKPAQSMPDLTKEISKPALQVNELITNNEYEKRLRKKFRTETLSRSLRRAKSVYYRNIRSKSLEDLTIEESLQHIKIKSSNSNLNLCFMPKQSKLAKLSKLNLNSSTESCISGLASDISSSYFHELSDWSPEFSSSESESSEEDDLFQSTNYSDELMVKLNYY